jgi:hypothetical protein
MVLRRSQEAVYHRVWRLLTAMPDPSNPKVLKRDVNGYYLYLGNQIEAVEGGYSIVGDESGKVFPTLDSARASINYRTNPHHHGRV